MDWSIRDNAQDRRFELADGDEVAGFVEYRLRDDVVTLLHTEVDSAFSGQGLGTALARGVLDEAASRRFSVIPRCPFIAGFIREHPEYADLVPARRRAEFGVG